MHGTSIEAESSSIDRAPAAENRLERGVSLAARLIATGRIAGLLGLVLVAAAAAGEPDTTVAPASANPIGTMALDFGGAEIDDTAHLRRNFGLDDDDTRSVRAGDMNGDGLLDLVVGRIGPDTVYLNAGEGRFDTEPSTLTIVPEDGEDPDHFVLGDLDLDGDLDAIGWPRDSASLGARLYLNDGGGQLALSSDFGMTAAGVSDVTIATFDVNDPGTSSPDTSSLDIAFAREGARNSYRLFENLVQVGGVSEPHFSAEVDFGAPDEATRALATGDLDGDGWIDIVAANGDDTGSQLSEIHLNQGGSFAEQTAACTAPLQRSSCLGTRGFDTRSVALGDVDADDHLDIVFGNRGLAGNPSLGQERILLNDGSGGFGASLPILLGPENDRTSEIALGDVNGDGRLDLLVGDEMGQDRVCYNDGATPPGFENCDPLGSTTSATSALALADLDDDGALDAAFGYVGQQSRIHLSPGALAFIDAMDASFGDAIEAASSIALGDIDEDGNLDAVVGNPNGPSQLYLGDGSGSFPAPPLAGFAALAPATGTRAVLMADLRGPDPELRRLSVLIGNDKGRNLYLTAVFNPDSFQFEGFIGGCPETCFGPEDDKTLALATGDLDWDGDLDIIVGNDGLNGIYYNDGFGDFNGPDSSASFGAVDDVTAAIAVADLNGDGYLDIVAGNRNGRSKAYLNDGNGGFDSTGTPFGIIQDTRSLALGDLDANGTIDAVLGNHMQQNRIHLGDGKGGFGAAAGGIDFGTGADATRSLSLGDLNGDGALDIIVGNEGESNAIYLNDHRSPPRFDRQRGFDRSGATTTSLALGDLDGNGTLDILAGHETEPLGSDSVDVFRNRYRVADRLALPMPKIRIQRPGDTPEAPGFSTAEILTARPGDGVSFYIYLQHPEGLRVARLDGFYSNDGGGSWQPADIGTYLFTEGGSDLVPKTDLIATPVESYYNIEWDPFSSGFFGRSDTVMLRVRAQLQSEDPYTMLEDRPGSSAGPIQWSYVTATSNPFRLRGSQARVVREDNSNPWWAPDPPAPDSLVYRLPEGQSEGALPFANAGGVPLRTDSEGYLRGTSTFSRGDTLFALFPITRTEHYVVYHGSAAVTNDGLLGQPVSGGAVTTLVVKESQPLMLFNLDISLEWDARNDEGFMQQLRDDIRRSSEILFDVTNGQVALGPVRIHHAKQEWLAADLVIKAANNLRPAASLGGVVDDPLDEQAQGAEVHDAYLPGQIQMGPSWGRFGDPGADLGQDWPRALAHELGHYLLFVMDNYLGVDGRRIVPNDCIGSFMTDAYFDEYSELLDGDEWTGKCQDTLANFTTGRTDWETVLSFYPWLNTEKVGLKGPSSLPLAVTQIEEIDPGFEPRALASPYYSLRDEDTERLFVGAGGGQGYLFKNQDTSTPTDDYVVAVGSPIGDQMHARGAEPGDRLCVIDRQREPLRVGCTEVGPFEGTLQMSQVPGWNPQIVVSPVTTDTLAITVTQSTNGILMAQILPQQGLSSTFPIISTVVELAPTTNPPDGVFTAQVKLAYPVLQASVRVWEPANPLREAMTQYVLGTGWGPNMRQWGPNMRQWGPNMRQWGPNMRQWGAPVSSGNGQVTVYNLDKILDAPESVSLQELSILPPIPSWLRPVGNLYRFEAYEAVTRTMAFLYLQQDVPGGKVYEEGARIYHSPDGGATWTMLDTILDAQENLATTEMPADGGGDGIYMLAITIPMPDLTPGWNLLGYPVGGERPVAEALASIADDYSMVYDNGPTAEGPWRLYDQEVIRDHPDLAGLVNDLDRLRFGGVYWIHALNAAQPFFGLPRLPGDGAPDLGESLDSIDTEDELPPATYFGWVDPSAGFAPSAGMEVVALVDDVVCGRSTVVDWNGRLAYKIQVAAKSPRQPGCASEGDRISFRIGGSTLRESDTWANRRSSFLSLENLASGADLSVEQIILPNEPQAGLPYAYLITVHNAGPLPATDVVLTSVAPAGAELILAAAEPRYCQTAAPVSTCQLGTLPSGSSQTVIVTLRLASAGLVTHDVSVTAFEPDPVPDDNQIVSEHQIVAQQGPPPTSVQLESFHAFAEPGDRHEVFWSTASEIDVLGFRVYGAPALEGPYQRVGAEIVPARAGAATGVRYQLIFRGGGSAYYRLETVTSGGLPQHFGPIPAERRAARTYLPLLQQR